MWIRILEIEGRLNARQLLFILVCARVAIQRAATDKGRTRNPNCWDDDILSQ